MASINVFLWRDTKVHIAQSTTLTVDPLNIKTALLTLQKGTKVILFGTMGNWAYVETTSGTWTRGFVPQSAPNYEQVYD